MISPLPTDADILKVGMRPPDASSLQSPLGVALITVDRQLSNLRARSVLHRGTIGQALPDPVYLAAIDKVAREKDEAHKAAIAKLTQEKRAETADALNRLSQAKDKEYLAALSKLTQEKDAANAAAQRAATEKLEAERAALAAQQVESIEAQNANLAFLETVAAAEEAEASSTAVLVAKAVRDSAAMRTVALQEAALRDATARRLASQEVALRDATALRLAEAQIETQLWKSSRRGLWPSLYPESVLHADLEASKPEPSPADTYFSTLRPSRYHDSPRARSMSPVSQKSRSPRKKQLPRGSMPAREVPEPEPYSPATDGFGTMASPYELARSPTYVKLLAARSEVERLSAQLAAAAATVRSYEDAAIGAAMIRADTALDNAVFKASELKLSAAARAAALARLNLDMSLVDAERRALRLRAY